MSSFNHETRQPSCRERVKTAMRHMSPDRVPVDLLATPEIWKTLVASLKPDASTVGESEYFDPAWEAILRHFGVDCRVLSYDQFCQPPVSVLHNGATIDWWNALSRSSPNRMWRQHTPDNGIYDIWGHHFLIAQHPTGAYEEFASWPLGSASSVEDLKHHPWPEPDWWDFSPLPNIIKQLDEHEEHHIRFRIGSIFEIGWQLRGMQKFLMDLALEPSIPVYIMDRLTEVHVENTRRVLNLVGDRLDMVYFYDDVATQESLMISKEMWGKYIRPCHEQVIEIAKDYGLAIMYHCDGSVYPLIPDLIDMGIDVLNPIQANAKDMDPRRLKAEFSDNLTFHGGIDILETLPRGTREDVANEVHERIHVLGNNGGYILASAHHIQPDTPIENILAMYDLELRYDRAQ